MLSQKQKEALKAIGGDRLVEFVESRGRKATQELEEQGVAFRSRTQAEQRALADYAQDVRALANEVEEAELKEALLKLADELEDKTIEEKRRILLRGYLRMRVRKAPDHVLRALQNLHRRASFRARVESRWQSSNQDQRSVPQDRLQGLRRRSARPVDQQHRGRNFAFRREMTPDEVVAYLESLLGRFSPEVDEKIKQLIERIRAEFPAAEPTYGYPEPQTGYGYPEPQVGYLPPQPSYPAPESTDTGIAAIRQELAQLRQELRQQRVPRAPRYHWYRASEQNDAAGQGPTVVKGIVERMKSL